jgi:argininosuccinate lyase
MELWDSGKTDKKAIEFSAGWDNKPGPPYDDLLIPYQIELDRVYSSSLLSSGYISSKQSEAIQNGLEELSKRHSSGELSVVGYEDVHSLVESKLNELYSAELVGNVHIGLSRNEQIATLMRMWMKNQASATNSDLTSFMRGVEQEIETNGRLAFVGYSHHRIAMPTTYGKLLESYAKGFGRDKKYLESWLEMYDECPLGDGAGFGSPIKLDRGRLAKELGFSRPTESSIDTVTTIWEPGARLADTIKIMMSHLSTIAQDFIINSMEGLNVILLPPEYCTGSSMMPQKLNPDVLETIKRKALDIDKEASKLSAIGIGNISGYNRDTQGAKYWIINVFQEQSGSLDIMSDVIRGAKVDERRVKELLEMGGAYAAEKAIRKSIEEKRPYRSTKLEIESEIKK